MAAARRKKNGVEQHVTIAREVGRWLLNGGVKPEIQLVGTALPGLAGVNGIVAKSAALLVRTLIINLPKLENEMKRHATGACLIGLAGLLEVLELPDDAPYWLREK